MKCRLVSPGSPVEASFVVNGFDLVEAGCIKSIVVVLDAEDASAHVSFETHSPDLDVTGETEPPASFLALAEAFGYVKLGPPEKEQA